ncbi:autoinducer binding domain-containing protein [Pseudomonas aeruginosa]|nr:autoinducer binding domain-containing protein [Pseudomonas aeruginosa]
MRNDGGFLLWWDGLRSEMQPIHDSQGVFAVLEKEVRRLGFDYYAYGVRHTIPFTRPKTEVHGTYPKAWLERYQMQNYGAVDPAILNGLRSSEMVVWSDSLFDQSRMLWNEARDWGLCVGATLPIRAPNNLLSVLSVARDQQNISSFEREEIRLRLRCMIELLTQKLTDLEHPMLMSNPVCLSHREREILQWTADAIEARLQSRLHPELCAVHPQQPLDFAEKAYLLPRDEAFKRYVDQWLHIAEQSGLLRQRMEHWLEYRWPTAHGK